MIVSFWISPMTNMNKNKLKRHIENAVKYAACEGGKIFLSEAGTQFASLLGEVIKEVSEKYSNISHMPIDNEELLSQQIDTYSEKTSTNLKTYLFEKADIIIIIEPKESIASHAIPKTTLRIKI